MLNGHGWQRHALTAQLACPLGYHTQYLHSSLSCAAHQSPHCFITRTFFTPLQLVAYSPSRPPEKSSEYRCITPARHRVNLVFMLCYELVSLFLANVPQPAQAKWRTCTARMMSVFVFISVITTTRSPLLTASSSSMFLQHGQAQIVTVSTFL
jgi:hypothetical protein